MLGSSGGGGSLQNCLKTTAAADCTPVLHNSTCWSDYFWCRPLTIHASWFLSKLASMHILICCRHTHTPGYFFAIWGILFFIWQGSWRETGNPKSGGRHAAKGWRLEAEPATTATGTSVHGVHSVTTRTACSRTLLYVTAGAGIETTTFRFRGGWLKTPVWSSFSFKF